MKQLLLPLLAVRAALLAIAATADGGLQSGAPGSSLTVDEAAPKQP